MEESILKAIALDTFEPGQKCSNVVDDVFFIIRKSIRYFELCETKTINKIISNFLKQAFNRNAVDRWSVCSNK